MERVIIGGGAGLQLVDGSERRIGGAMGPPGLNRADARQGRIDVSSIDELAAEAPHISGLEHAARPQRLLHVEVEVLHVRVPQILVDRQHPQDGYRSARPWIDTRLSNQAWKRAP